MVNPHRMLAIALGITGALLMGFSQRLSPILPELGQFDWWMFAGIICLITAGLLFQRTWGGRHR